jgi:drug/metabolite transporter (DMT)-like permease
MRWNLGLAGLAVSWGLIAVIAGSVGVGGAQLAFLRLVLAALTLGAVAVAGGRLGALRPGRHLAGLLALGVVQAAHWWLFFEAVKLGSVALAVLTFYAAPLFLAVLAPIVLPERLSNVALGALVVGGAGIVLVAIGGDGGGGFGWVALGCGLGSALTFAVLVLISKRLLGDGAAPLTVAFWDCLVGAAVMIAPAVLAAGTLVPADASEWGAILLLGIVFTGASTLVYAMLLRHVTAQTAGILTFLEPVSAVVLAWIFLDEPLTIAGVVGGCLVLCAGVAVVTLEPSSGRVSEAVAGVGSTVE